MFEEQRKGQCGWSRGSDRGMRRGPEVDRGQTRDMKQVEVRSVASVVFVFAFNATGSH